MSNVNKFCRFWQPPYVRGREACYLCGVGVSLRCYHTVPAHDDSHDGKVIVCIIQESSVVKSTDLFCMRIRKKL